MSIRRKFTNKSSEFEAGLRRLQEISSNLDSIMLPPELISNLKSDIEQTKLEESKDEDLMQKESILKQFHQELSDRVLFSTQLARSLNKSIKSLEEQMREKAFKVIAQSE
mmetsp:Transcript_35567/g.41163  ORF Transcript_35567/g.41163 Transcript_35567/m.41163 type:complete len:110 (-) Transcript_35567:79-408(-)